MREIPDRSIGLRLRPGRKIDLILRGGLGDYRFRMKIQFPSLRVFTALTAGLAVLLVPSLAQGSGVGAGSGTGTELDRPIPPSAASGSNTGSSPSPGSPRSGTGMNADAGASAALSGGADLNFEQLDANGDGRISAAEYKATEVAAPTQAQGNGSESTGGRSGASTGVDGVPLNDDAQRSVSGPGMAGSAHNSASTTPLFIQADRDGDGYLSRHELEAAKRNRGVRTTK